MGLRAHFFFIWGIVESSVPAVGGSVQSIIEASLEPMGIELVDVEFGQRGLLRVFIDAPAGIRLEDCEQVSRQLSHVLAVESVDYSRLEVSSPGLDRPLRRERDFQRFTGSRITLRLRQAFQGRRNFEGLLTAESDGRFGLELIEPEPQPVRGRRPVKSVAASRVGRKAAAQSVSGEPRRKLVFSLDEIERARLVPIVKF